MKPKKGRSLKPKVVRHHWYLASLDVVLLEDVVGRGDETFRKGTRMRVVSMPIWDTEDGFGLKATDAPEFLPNGPWRGAGGVLRRQFETRRRP